MHHRNPLRRHCIKGWSPLEWRRILSMMASIKRGGGSAGGEGDYREGRKWPE